MALVDVQCLHFAQRPSAGAKPALVTVDLPISWEKS